MKLRYTFTGTMDIDPETFLTYDDLGVLETERLNVGDDPCMYMDMLDNLNITVEEVTEVSDG